MPPLETDPVAIMRTLYGETEGQCCGNCEHLLALEHEPTTYRCGRTDWARTSPSWPLMGQACGQFILRPKTKRPKKLLEYLRWLRLEDARQGK